MLCPYPPVGTHGSCVHAYHDIAGSPLEEAPENGQRHSQWVMFSAKFNL